MLLAHVWRGVGANLSLVLAIGVASVSRAVVLFASDAGMAVMAAFSAIRRILPICLQLLSLLSVGSAADFTRVSWDRVVRVAFIVVVVDSVVTPRPISTLLGIR